MSASGSKSYLGGSPMSMDLFVLSIVEQLGIVAIELASLIRSFAFSPSLPNDELSCKLSFDGQPTEPLSAESASLVFSWLGRWLGTHAVEDPYLSSLHLAFWRISEHGLRLRLDILALNEDFPADQSLVQANIWYCWKQKKWGILRIGGVRYYLRQTPLSNQLRRAICICSPCLPIASFLQVQLDLIARRFSTLPAHVSLIRLLPTSPFTFEASFNIDQSRLHYACKEGDEDCFIVAFYFDHTGTYRAAMSAVCLSNAISVFRRTLSTLRKAPPSQSAKIMSKVC